MRGKGRGKNKIVDWQLVAAPADDIVEIDIPTIQQFFNFLLDLSAVPEGHQDNKLYSA